MDPGLHPQIPRYSRCGIKLLEMEAMACPVCTLYLREGMSMQSHLNTHPKDQVIEALVRLYTSGGGGGPPPPMMAPYPMPPPAPFMQVVAEEQIIMGRSQVTTTNILHPPVMPYPVWTETPQQQEMRQGEYNGGQYMEDGHKEEVIDVDTPDGATDESGAPVSSLADLSDNIQGSSGVKDIGTMIRDAAGVIMNNGDEEEDMPHNRCPPPLLTRGGVYLPGPGGEHSRQEEQDHHHHEAASSACCASSGPVSPPAVSNHSAITVRTDLTNPEHTASGGVSGATAVGATAVCPGVGSTNGGVIHHQYITPDCDYQDEDARDGDIIDMDRDPISIDDMEDETAREKEELGEGACSELNIQADERMPARGELSGQGSLGNTIETVWLPQEETPMVPSATWEERESKAVKRTYRCLHCQEGFSCPKERRVHISSIHNNTSTDSKKDIKAIECTKCSIVMDSLKQLKEHTRTLHKRASRMCAVCSETFPTKGSYVDHLVKVHPLECSVCGKTFHTKAGLALHTKIHLPVKPHPCNMCEKSFVTAQKLREHVNTHTGYAPLQCNMCDRKFKRYSNLKQHKDVAHLNVKKKTKEFFCECGESFTSKKKLAWHQETHLEKPKQCAYCSERYVHGSSLTRHIRRAHDSHYLPQGQKAKSKNVQCPVCNLVFLESSLRAHMRRHGAPKQYGCIMCGKKFRTKWNLHLHRWTHASRHAKPYKCNQCKAAFIRLTDFQAHVRSHYGQKPFTCNHCGMQFNRKNNWQRHEKEHTATKNYTCDECGKTFHRNYYLVEHTRIHSGIKPYSCHICNKTSATKSNHNKHLRTHHARETINTEG